MYHVLYTCEFFWSLVLHMKKRIRKLKIYFYNNIFFQKSVNLSITILDQHFVLRNRFQKNKYINNNNRIKYNIIYSNNLKNLSLL